MIIEILLVILLGAISGILVGILPLKPKEKAYNVQDEMNFFNEAKWVEKVILSCKTQKQTCNAYELIAALCDKYKTKVKSSILWLVRDNLVYNVWSDHIEKV